MRQRLYKCVCIACRRRSPFLGSKCWWGIECDRPFLYVSAGGDVSAIALFCMSVLVGVGVRSCLWNWRVRSLLFYMEY
ncbi:hypothetical protein [Aerosakkonema funiforme]|uniref:hypothetical protein n=1 Tax=Aerosakkonema funiforme TaxID=1246630 RepID=UPI0035BB1CAE